MATSSLTKRVARECGGCRDERPVDLGKDESFGQMDPLSGFVYSVEVGCQNPRSDTMSEYKPEEY